MSFVRLFFFTFFKKIFHFFHFYLCVTYSFAITCTYQKKAVISRSVLGMNHVRRDDFRFHIPELAARAVPRNAGPSRIEQRGSYNIHYLEVQNGLTTGP